MLIAAVFDFFDGFTARLLKVTSPIGKDLDSLADIVTFGVLPGFFMMDILEINLPYAEGVAADLPFLALLIPVFSALRLAKFNNDPTQSYGFKGLPTPANGLILASYALWVQGSDGSMHVPQLFTQTWFNTALVLLQCVLLVSSIPLMAMKFSDFSVKTLMPRVLLVLFAGILIWFLRFGAGLPVLILYIIFSLINHFSNEIQSRN
jgi:CDP-diacylglycerol--serine O-phosphatidyltransferase